MEQMYYKCHSGENNEIVIDGYAYGEYWVAVAMYIDDLIFDTPEKAKEWWNKQVEKGANQ